MQKRVPEEAPSHVLYRKFCTHFFDVAKKAAPECVCLRNLYTRASENASEKSAKKLVRGSLLSENTETGQKNEKVCKMQIVRSPRQDA